MKFENNTYILDAKTNPKDRVEVEIGDAKQQDFHPQVKIKRWDNEVNTSFRYVHDEKNPAVVEEDGKVKWIGKDTEAHFYELTEGEGGYEFEVILKKKPVSNVVQFTLNTKDLDFFYQPALTEQEIDDGVNRPENVIGSYAVYASENKVNIVGGKEYKCGKVGHIYRPKIIDALGVEVWGELSIDTEAGILSVTVPKEFLDEAKYPVIVDPTFGYTGVGASNSALTAGTAYGILAMPEGGDGYVDSMTGIFSYTTSTRDIKNLIVDNSLNIISNGVTDAVTINSTVYSQFTTYFPTRPAVSNGTNYYIAIISSTGGTLNNKIDSVPGCGKYDNTNNFTTPENMGPGTQLDNRISFFATYSVYDEAATHFYLKQGWQ